MPALTLADDLMIFYAPLELYTQNVTVMELICASVCLTSMLCYTLEAKRRSQNPVKGVKNPFDAQVHMARHRLGARGATQPHFHSRGKTSWLRFNTPTRMPLQARLQICHGLAKS